MIALYRVGAHIPVPGRRTPTTIEAARSAVRRRSGCSNLFSGGALEQFAVFSLGIMPYITASIIMQLLQGVIPKIEQWPKEGESGQRKITQITRYMTLGIALLRVDRPARRVPGSALTAGRRASLRRGSRNVVIVITLIAGTAFIMWMGELITQRGIGNGMSLLIFASIVARFPSGDRPVVPVRQRACSRRPDASSSLFIIAAIVTMERAQRRIPVQYAKRVVGRKVYGGAGTYIPLKINGANVIPIIFASAILFFPAQIAHASPSVPWLQTARQRARRAAG